MINYPSFFRQMMYFDNSSYYILDYKRSDVNGDRIYEDIYLLGDKPNGEGSPFADNIIIAIYDAKVQKFYKIPLSSNAGYVPRLFTGDFTGDGIKDILAIIDSGGSGGLIYAYIYTFLNNKPLKIFDYNLFNEEFNYEVHYRDDYKVEVLSNALNESYTIDIGKREEEYLSQIYDENGKLKEQIYGEVIPLGDIFPIDIDGDRVYELIAVQRIIGRYNADTLGFIETYLKWDGENFEPFKQYAAILGDER